MNRTKYIIGGIIIVLLLGVSFWGYSIFNTYTLKEYVVDTPTGSFTINTTTGMEQLLLPLHLLILAFIAWNVICADHLGFRWIQGKMNLPGAELFPHSSALYRRGI